MVRTRVLELTRIVVFYLIGVLFVGRFREYLGISFIDIAVFRKEI